MEFQLFESLKKAYETTTLNYNKFQAIIESVKWDNVFHADGEIYFCKDGFTLTIENINPFAEAWRPSVMFSDGSILTF